MTKRGPKPKARSTSVADAITWVMRHFDDPDDVVENLDGLVRYMWFQAHDHEDKFFEKHVPKAIVVTEVEEGDSQKEEAERGSEKHLEHLKRRLRELLKGTELIYCQKCWAEISPRKGVRVVQ